MRTMTLRFSLLAGIGILLTGSSAHAQDQVARSYTVMPKAGMVPQFEAALKAHIEWRMENGDPWTWGVSTVEVGDRLGEYRIRSGGHAWADFDAYDAGFGPEGLVHWQATVAPLVESVSSTVSTVDAALSNLPPAGTEIAFVNVTVFHLRPGRQADFNQAVARATAILKEADWGGFSAWTFPISGGGTGPRMNLVSFHDSWADMAEPDPSFEAVMVQEMGQEAFMEWIADVGQMYRGVESYTLRLRPDLGVNQN